MYNCNVIDGVRAIIFRFLIRRSPAPLLDGDGLCQRTDAGAVNIASRGTIYILYRVLSTGTYTGNPAIGILVWCRYWYYSGNPKALAL